MDAAVMVDVAAAAVNEFAPGLHGDDNDALHGDGGASKMAAPADAEVVVDAAVAAEAVMLLLKLFRPKY